MPLRPLVADRKGLPTAGMKQSRPGTTRRILFQLALYLGVGTGPTLWYFWTALFDHNFRSIVPGRIYRSGQLPAAPLAEAIDRMGLRTVVNLRGANPEVRSYRDEVRVCAAKGVRLYSLHMHSNYPPTPAQVRRLIDVFDRGPYPLLIHCATGADRSAVAAAIYELACNGQTPYQAKRQFSLRYLYVRRADRTALMSFIESYEHWLAGGGQAQSQAAFRHWAQHVYHPDLPRWLLDEDRAPSKTEDRAPYSLGAARP